MNIIARKQRMSGSEYIVVDRGEGTSMRFVSATATVEFLTNGEWFWGHYFETEQEAMSHFNSRGEV